MEMGFADVSELATAISTAGVTSVVVDDASLFTVGARIYNKTKDLTNSEAGWAVTAVNTSTNTLTVSPAIDGSGTAWALNDEIAGYLPEGTALGTALASRLNVLQIEGVTVAMRSGELTVNDPVGMVDEIDGNDYPTDFLEDKRSISGSSTIYLRQGQLKWYNIARSATVQAVKYICGNVAGSIVEFSMPQASLDGPAVRSSAPAFDLDLSFMALGSSGEDSLSITFK